MDLSKAITETMNRKGFLSVLPRCAVAPFRTNRLPILFGIFSSVITFVVAPLFSPAYAATPTHAPLPSHPSAPKSITVKQVKDAFGNCRRFIVEGESKPTPCDSNVENDALHLRPLVEENPAAKNELDTYQSNRRLVKRLPYYGTIGLGFIIAGLVLQKTKNGTEGIAIRNVGLFTGGLIILGTATYGAILLNSNEAHLNRAIQLHNDANPNHSIGIQVRTEF